MKSNLLSRVHGLWTQTPNSSKHPLSYHWKTFKSQLGNIHLMQFLIWIQALAYSFQIFICTWIINLRYSLDKWTRFFNQQFQEMTPLKTMLHASWVSKSPHWELTHNFFNGFLSSNVSTIHSWIEWINEIKHSWSYMKEALMNSCEMK